jgi:hypothetical protein
LPAPSFVLFSQVNSRILITISIHHASSTPPHHPHHAINHHIINHHTINHHAIIHQPSSTPRHHHPPRHHIHHANIIYTTLSSSTMASSTAPSSSTPSVLHWGAYFHKSRTPWYPHHFEVILNTSFWDSNRKLDCFLEYRHVVLFRPSFSFHSVPIPSVLLRRFYASNTTPSITTLSSVLLILQRHHRYH